MLMTKDVVSAIILIILMGVTSIHSLWGKKLPRPIWVISVISSAIIGIYIGYLLLPFPESLYISLPCGLLFVCTVLLQRLARKNHED